MTPRMFRLADGRLVRVTVAPNGDLLVRDGAKTTVVRGAL